MPTRRRRDSGSSQEQLVPHSPGQLQAVSLLRSLGTVTEQLKLLHGNAPDDVSFAASTLPHQALSSLLKSNEQVIGLLKASNVGVLERTYDFLGLGMKVNAAQVVAISNTDDEIIRHLMETLQDLQGNVGKDALAARTNILEHVATIQQRRHDAIGKATWLPMILAFLLCVTTWAIGARYGVPTFMQ
jgi:hypothetical protein